MGAGLKIFIVNSDASLEKLPAAKYERLIKYDPKERIPKYSGKRVQYVLVLIEYNNRRPIRIIQKQYSYLNFDSEGRLDQYARKNIHRLALEGLSERSHHERRGNLIDARQLFAKRKLRNYYAWIPNDDVYLAIVRAIFGEKSMCSNHPESVNINELF